MPKVVVIRAMRSKAAQKHVEERVALKQCVACDPTDIRPYRRRGLCPRCEQRWAAQRDSIASDERKAEFDAELMRKGYLLEPQEIIRLNDLSNPFREVASNFVS